MAGVYKGTPRIRIGTQGYGRVYNISAIFFTNLAQYSSLISNSLSFLSSFRLIRPWREM